MRILGNFLWCCFGGGVIAILWALAGLLCCCTIIGIPMGVQCFKFASFIIWPFGRNVVYSGHTVSFLANIIWIMVFGWELAAFSLLLGIIWCITIVGIPFGQQCFKFAKLALMPFGAQII